MDSFAHPPGGFSRLRLNAIPSPHGEVVHGMGYTAVCTGCLTVGANWKIRQQQDWEAANFGNFPLGMLVALQQAVTLPLAGMWIAKVFSTVSRPGKEETLLMV